MTTFECKSWKTNACHFTVITFLGRTRFCRLSVDGLHSIINRAVPCPGSYSFFPLSLQDRQLVRNLCRAGQRPNYPETDEALVPIFRKLHSQGITEEDEDKLLFLKEVILKLHRAKTR